MMNSITEQVTSNFNRNDDAANLAADDGDRWLRWFPVRPEANAMRDMNRACPRLANLGPAGLQRPARL